MTSRTAIQVLDRMMSLLDALAQSDEAVSLKKLAELTELHPSTAHRILNDMVACRLVERADSGTYRLGLKLLELGNLVKARLSVRDAANLPMRALHKLTGQTVNLSVRQGDEIVYIDRAYSERSGMQVVRAIGGRAPLHLTSVGKLFLADDDAAKLKSYVAKTGLKSHTANSISSLAPWEIYRRTHYTIACETIGSGGCFFMSEKTTKAMLAKRLVIPIGTQHLIKNMELFLY